VDLACRFVSFGETMNPFEYIDFEKWFGWTYEAGGTTVHMQSVTASHNWNMEYGRGGLSWPEWNDYVIFAEGKARALIDSGQDENFSSVRRYWEQMEEYLLDVSPAAAAAAGAGVEAAKAHEGRITEKKDFPWWLLAGGAVLLLWRK